MSERVLVVGGGIAGLISALAEARRGNRVQLIEREPTVGGLLRSIQDTATGCWFDHGTHVPAQTGAADLDAELFDALKPGEWRQFPHLKAATLWNGTLNTQSPCLDLRSLADPIFDQVLSGLTETREQGKAKAVLSEELDREYGPAARRHVFDPILIKFFGVSADRLAPGAHRLFGLIRFIGPEEEQTAELKKDPIFDGRLAFHKAGSSGSLSYYPVEGGCGRWIEAVVSRVRDQGVELKNGLTVTKIAAPAREAQISDGRTIQYDRLLWTLPAALLLRVASCSGVIQAAPPPLSAISLYHFVCSSRSLLESQYVTCYDPAYRTFRVTIYGNLQEETPGCHRLTVEVLRPEPGLPAPSPAAIFEEVIRMGLVSARCRYSSCLEQQIPHGFPIQTPSFQRDAAAAAYMVSEQVPGADLAGRGAGQSFFLKDVLLEAWRKSSSCVGK